MRDGSYGVACNGFRGSEDTIQEGVVCLAFDYTNRNPGYVSPMSIAWITVKSYHSVW